MLLPSLFLAFFNYFLSNIWDHVEVILTISHAQIRVATNNFHIDNKLQRPWVSAFVGNKNLELGSGVFAVYAKQNRFGITK